MYFCFAANIMLFRNISKFGEKFAKKSRPGFPRAASKLGLKTVLNV